MSWPLIKGIGQDYERVEKPVTVLGSALVDWSSYAYVSRQGLNLEQWPQADGDPVQDKCALQFH